jgi:hypothetical protein
VSAKRSSANSASAIAEEKEEANSDDNSETCHAGKVPSNPAAGERAGRPVKLRAREREIERDNSSATNCESASAVEAVTKGEAQTKDARKTTRDPSGDAHKMIRDTPPAASPTGRGSHTGATDAARRYPAGAGHDLAAQEGQELTGGLAERKSSSSSKSSLRLSDVWEVHPDDVKRIRCIGRGACGTVWEGEWRRGEHFSKALYTVALCSNIPGH